MDIPNTDNKAKARAQIAEHVRIERARQQLTQIDVAEKAGVSPTRVYEIEQGESDPRLSTLLRVVDALGLVLSVDRAAA